MRISAKADYAVRAAIELAAATDDKPVKAERIATNQEIPLNFLENILGELRHAGIVRSHRGADGGFRLARPAADVTVADIIRAVDGPLRYRSGWAARGFRVRRGRERAAASVDRGAQEPPQRCGARDARRCRERAVAGEDRAACERSGGVGYPVVRPAGTAICRSTGVGFVNKSSTFGELKR